MAEAKKKRGRPNLYKDEYCEQARKLCRLGAIDTELAEFFGVTVTTLNNWKIEHPDFDRAKHHTDETIAEGEDDLNTVEYGKH